MIDVPVKIKEILDSDLRNIVYKVEIARPDITPMWFDITDRVLGISVDGDLESSSLVCNLEIDNSDFSYNPLDPNNNVNNFGGVYDPLIYPGRLVRVSAGFKEAIEEQDIITYVEASHKIDKMDSYISKENIALTSNGGITLNGSYGNLYVIDEQLQQNSSMPVGTVFYGGTNCDLAQVVQEFTLTGNTIKKIENIELRFRVTHNDTHYGNGRVLVYFYNSLPGDPPSFQHEYNGPHKNKIGETKFDSFSEISYPFDSWKKINIDGDLFLEPNKKYAFKIWDSHGAHNDYASISYLNRYYYGNVQHSGGALWNYVGSQNVETRVWQKYTNRALAYKIWGRDLLYNISGNAIYEFDCGYDISSYTDLKITATIPDGTSINYECSVSNDRIKWSDWENDLSDLIPSRYLRVKVSLYTTSNTKTPEVSKIILNYKKSHSEVHTGYISLFHGLTGDDIDLQTESGKILLTCRDFSKNYQDLFVTLSDSYTNIYSEVIIKDLLIKFTPQTLLKNYFKLVDDYFIYSDTDFLITNFVIRNENLWTSMQKIADVMGWYLRFDEHGYLILRNRRKNSICDVIFDEDDIIKIPINFSDADIRNDIVVKAETSSNGIVEANLKDEESIERFGRKYMEVDRTLTSMISTQEQVNNLSKAILEDYAWLRADVNIEIPFYPIIQLDDIVGIRVKDLALDETVEIYKVVSYKHNLSSDNKRTTLTLKTHKSFFKADNSQPNPPTNLQGSFITREIKNYPGCGWQADSKKFYYPYITWTHPSGNTDGSELSLDKLSGYNIYRSNNEDNVFEYGIFINTNINNNGIQLSVSGSASIFESHESDNASIKIADAGIGQIFTCSETENVTSIAVKFNNFESGSTVALKLMDYGQKTVYGEYVITGSGSGWYNFNFYNAIQLNAGSKYCFVLYHTGNNTVFYNNSLNGNMIINKEHNTAYDLCYRVYCRKFITSGNYQTGSIDFGGIPTSVKLYSNISCYGNSELKLYYKVSDDNINWNNWTLVDNFSESGNDVEIVNILGNYRFVDLMYDFTSSGNVTPIVNSFYLVAIVNNTPATIYYEKTMDNYLFVGYVPLHLANSEIGTNWYIDYMSGPGNFKYKVSAVNINGNKSDYSNEEIVSIPYPLEE